MFNSLRISLIEKCNYKCFFCHNEGNQKVLNSNLITEKRIKTLMLAANNIGVQKVTISGGEPFLHKDISKLVKAIKETNKNTQINIATNLSIAKWIDLEKISKYINKVNINFQALDSIVQKKVTGVCSLDIVKEKISFLKKNGVHISLNFVYTRRNSKELIPILDFAEKHNYDLKILELVKMTQDDCEYENIQGARATVLAHRQDLIKTYKKNQSDEVFQYTKNKIRIIYSYDNTDNIEAHDEHGELRITPEAYIRPSLKYDHYNLSLINELDTENINKISERLVLAYNLYKNKNCTLAAISIIKYKDKFVMVKRKLDNGDYSFETPGGKIEIAETPEQAAVREAKEESGLDVKIIKKISSEYTNNSLGHFYECELLNEEQLIANKQVFLFSKNELNSLNITPFSKTNLIKLGYL